MGVIMEKLLVKKMRDDAIIPTRATDGSAGFDLYACIDAPVEIEPHKCVGIPSGIAISLPDKNCAALMLPTAKTSLLAALCVISIISSLPAKITVCSPTMFPPRTE